MNNKFMKPPSFKVDAFTHNGKVARCEYCNKFFSMRVFRNSVQNNIHIQCPHCKKYINRRFN